MTSGETFTFTVDTFINKRYNYLENSANNILKLVKKNNTNFKYDLVTECYNYLINNVDKLYDKIILSGMIESIAIRWMDKQVRWKDTAFKKDFLFPGKRDKIPYYDFESRSQKLRQIEIVDIEQYAAGCEIASLDADYEEQIELVFDDLNRHNRLQVLLNMMSTEQRILFDIVYIKGHNTTEKLHSYLKRESRSSCYKMLKKLRDYIAEQI